MTFPLQMGQHVYPYDWTDLLLMTRASMKHVLLAKVGNGLQKSS